MTEVSTSYGILFDVRGVVSTSAGIVFDVRAVTTPKSFALEHDVRSIVSASPKSLEYDVRKVFSPAKVAIISYGIRKSVSKSFSVKYGVRVPVASDKTLDVVYDVRLEVLRSPFAVQYDTEVIGDTEVSKSLEISYHTLVTPTVDQIITVPVERSSVPPQIVTTSF